MVDVHIAYIIYFIVYIDIIAPFKITTRAGRTFGANWAFANWAGRTSRTSRTSGAGGAGGAGRTKPIITISSIYSFINLSATINNLVPIPLL